MHISITEQNIEQNIGQNTKQKIKQKIPRKITQNTNSKTAATQELMLMYGKVSQENYVELTAASAIPNKEIKSPQILRY